MFILFFKQLEDLGRHFYFCQCYLLGHIQSKTEPCVILVVETEKDIALGRILILVNGPPTKFQSSSSSVKMEKIKPH